MPDKCMQYTVMRDENKRVRIKNNGWIVYGGISQV